MIQLRRLREARGLSQQKLAEQIGLSQQKIHAYETGINEPNIDTLMQLATFFDTSVDYLIGNTLESRKIEKGQPYELNEAESELVDIFRQLSPRLRNSLIMFLKALHHPDEEPS